MEMKPFEQQVLPGLTQMPGTIFTVRRDDGRRRRYVSLSGAVRGLAYAKWHERYIWVQEGAGQGEGYWEQIAGTGRGTALVETSPDQFSLRYAVIERLARFYQRCLKARKD